MPRYLSPKADLVFKKVFADHPDLLKSFLNAVLPLSGDGLIEHLDYLPSEQVPVLPVLLKNSVVDVRCTDKAGRVFIVEMQIEWTEAFMQRMLFNAGKAYVKQLEKGEDYCLLKPVYGLSLVDAIFFKHKAEWYHHFSMVNVEDPSIEIKDLQLVFVELPKFKAKSFSDKKLQVLWLRFLSELDEHTESVPEEWLAVPEIKKAVELSAEAAYSRPELETYERYWDTISAERTLLNGALREGLEKGHAEGLAEGHAEGHAQGHAEGLAEGERKANIKMAKLLLAEGTPIQKVAQITGLDSSLLNNL